MVLPGRPFEKALLRYLDHPKRRRHAPAAHVFLTDEGDPLTLNTLQKAFRRRGGVAETHANPHKWRHSAAIQYLRGGGRIETLKALLGHTTLAMTLHYARIAGVDLPDAHAVAGPARQLKTGV